MHLCIRILNYTALLHFASLACFCVPPPESSSKKFWKTNKQTKLSIFPSSNDAKAPSDVPAPYDDTSISPIELHNEYSTARVRLSRSVPHLRINSKSSPDVHPIPPIPHDMFVETPNFDSDYYPPILPSHVASDSLPENILEDLPIPTSSNPKDTLIDKDDSFTPEFQSKLSSRPHFADREEIRKQRDSIPPNAGPSSNNANSRRGIQPLHLGKIPIEPSQVDWEYKYTRLLIDKLWDHLLAREMNPTVRTLLMQERIALERLVR